MGSLQTAPSVVQRAKMQCRLADDEGLPRSHRHWQPGNFLLRKAVAATVAGSGVVDPACSVLERTV